MSLLRRLFGGGPRRETTRAEMDDALKRLVVPYLRDQGFKGSLPHFRRPRGDGFDILSVQFSQWGGSFCVEVARCLPGTINRPGGAVQAAKAKAWDLPKRYRVGAEKVGWDHWFDFGKADPDAVAQELIAELENPRTWQFADTLPVDWPQDR